MKLYFSPGACSLSPHIVIQELGLKAELVKVDLKAHTLSDGSDFYAINSKGSVPFLVLDDGSQLSEGSAIVQYLADLKPESGLLPKYGSFERAKIQEWLSFISTEIHKGFSPLFAPDVPEEYKTMARQKLTQRYEYINRHLAKNEFLGGAQFSVADAYLFTTLGWLQFIGLNLSPLKNITAYVEKIAERASVKAARAVESA